MALRFSSGLLTGLQQYGQGGGAIPRDPRERNAMQAAGVTNPLLQQFGRGLGGMFGTEMRSPAELEKEKMAAALDTSFEKATQGTASAQEGNVAGVGLRISQLQEAMKQANTLEEKRLYASQIRELQGLMPAAKRVETTDKAKAILQLEKALESNAIDNPEALDAYTKRLKELKKDPEVIKQYNGFKMEEWQAQRAQQEMEAQQWLQSNSAAIDKALQDEDFEELNKVLAGAGANLQAAQAYAARSAQNQKTFQELEENSIERKRAPSTQLWQDKIDSLPAEAQKGLEPLLKAYKEAAKGYNEESGVWSTGARLAAKRIESEMGSMYRALQIQAAQSEYARFVKNESSKQRAIKDLELELKAPMPNSYLTQAERLLRTTLDKREKPTLSAIKNLAEELYSDYKAGLQVQLDSLLAEDMDEDGSAPDWLDEAIKKAGSDGGFSVKNTKGKVITREYAMAAKEKGYSAEQLAEASNISLDQARVLMGTPVQASEDTSDVMSRREQVQLQRSQRNRG